MIVQPRRACSPFDSSLKFNEIKPVGKAVSAPPPGTGTSNNGTDSSSSTPLLAVSNGSKAANVPASTTSTTEANSRIQPRPAASRPRNLFDDF